jgi:hypothetical protein
MWMYRDTEAIRIIWTTGGHQPQGHTLSVAVPAADTDLRTAGDWIPSGFGPFDFGVLCHRVSQKQYFTHLRQFFKVKKSAYLLHENVEAHPNSF